MAEASKQDMYEWLDEDERTIRDIREHVDALPEGEEGWEDEHYAHLAHIVVHLTRLARHSYLLAEVIQWELGSKIRSHAEEN